jgi:hypothetical protein
VDQAGGQRTVAEVGIRAAVEHGYRALVKDGYRALLDDCGLLVLGVLVVDSVLHARNIEPLGRARLVAREVITGQQDSDKSGVSWIDARIDVGDNARSGDVETVLGSLQLDNLFTGVVS